MADIISMKIDTIYNSDNIGDTQQKIWILYWDKLTLNNLTYKKVKDMSWNSISNEITEFKNKITQKINYEQFPKNIKDMDTLCGL